MGPETKIRILGHPKIPEIRETLTGHKMLFAIVEKNGIHGNSQPIETRIRSIFSNPEIAGSAARMVEKENPEFCREVWIIEVKAIQKIT